MRRKLFSILVSSLLLVTGCAQARGNPEEVVLTVKWMPDRKSGNEIRIKVSMAGLPWEEYFDTVSPWEKAIRKTDRNAVYLEAHQSDGAILECFIVHNGVKMPTDRIVGKGSVSCGQGVQID